MNAIEQYILVVQFVVDLLLAIHQVNFAVTAGKKVKHPLEHPPKPT